MGRECVQLLILVGYCLSTASCEALDSWRNLVVEGRQGLGLSDSRQKVGEEYMLFVHTKPREQHANDVFSNIDSCEKV